MVGESITERNNIISNPQMAYQECYMEQEKANLNGLGYGEIQDIIGCSPEPMLRRFTADGRIVKVPTGAGPIYQFKRRR